MPNPESAQEPVAAVAPPLQLGLLVPKSPLLCLCQSSVFLCLPCVGLLQRLILWVRPTFRAHVAFLTSVPTNKILAGIRILVLMLTFFLDVLTVTVPFLALLATFAKPVHVHRI